jgi:bifunctional non-homologous end joining protein LigD
LAGQLGKLLEQLDDISDDGGEGDLDFGRGVRLHVSSLDKVYFPDDGITKGDVMRYYVGMSPFLLPLIKDRPLILKRYPDGIDGPSFFQQNASDKTPKVVRVERVKTAGAQALRIVGGDLPTLLYLVQIGTIAIHAWQSRVTAAKYPDTTTIDLDPGDDVGFADVVRLSRYIKAELDRMKLAAAIKTSGSSGMHVALPLPPRTPYSVAAALANAIAQRVALRHPDLATTERSIRARPAGTIYVDAQQNAEGKSVVVAYSVREKRGAPVSAPIDWRELRASLRISSFAVGTMPARVKKVGDLWGPVVKRRNAKRDIERVLRDA